MLDLTVCSVSYDSFDYLNLNTNLTIPHGIDWVVALNKQKERPSLFVRSVPGVPEPTDVPEGFVGKASYHHAAALNMLCQTQEFKTRYVLFLDPDFFIVPRLDYILDYMRGGDLSFFGAPYYLEEGKVRVYDFPVAYCMFVDSTKVDIKGLDFTVTPNRDTGYKIYEKYKFSPEHKYEAVLPHYSRNHSIIPTTTMSIQSKYGYVPQSKMDQFFWQDKLYGVHVHCKLHLRGPEDIKLRAKAHIKDIKNIIGLSRNDTTV